MKQFRYLLLSLLLAFAMVGCGEVTSSAGSGSDEGNGTEGTSNGDQGSTTSSGGKTLSTWDKHSVRTEAGSGAGKWLASVAFGEEMELLGETIKEEGKDREYEKVRLLDGKEGWIRSDLIARKASLAVVTDEAQIYSRPSISNITDNTVDAGTMVVITQEKDEFSEFVGKNDASGKRAKGWLLGEKSLSTDASDIAAGIMLSKAMDEKNPIARTEKLKEFLDNPTYGGSAFAATAQAELDKADQGSKLSEDQLMITGDNLNVRSAPTTEEDNKIFQLSAGDVCRIVKKGDMAEIGGTMDYWYQIEFEGQTGWIFGKFTTKAL